MKGLDSLDLFDFGILLQALSNNMKVGILAVRADSKVKYLQIDKSRLVGIYTPRPKVSLGRVLYNYRAIERGPLRAAMEALTADPSLGPLGEYLLKNGAVSADQLRKANHYQLIEETLELFYWKNVGFKFVNNGARDSLPPGVLASVGQPIEIDALLIQCTKTIDDIAKFDEVTPSLRDVYELHIDSFEMLEELVPDPAQREFVLLIDGVRDMREVLRDMRMNRFEVLEFFYRFRQQGLIRPKNAFELLMLAENRKREFSLEKRARVYERVNELGVEGFEVLLPLAETYEELGANDRAAGLFARHARRCMETGDSKGALNAAVRATKLQSDDPEMRAFEIDVLIRYGRPAEASAAYLALAAIQEKAGDLAGALSSLRRAAKLDPTEPSNWRALAEMHEKQGRRRRAAARLRRAGDATTKLGDPAGAIEAYRRSLALCPGAWSVRYRLVEILHTGGQHDVAIQELSDLIQFVLAARALDRESQVNHLIHIEECLRLTGGMISSAATHLGRAYVRLEAKERAVAVLRGAAEALATAKRYRGAIDTLEELIELAPADLDARRSLARAHLALGDVNRAVAQLRRVGTQFVGAARWPEARDLYEEMLRADPGCADGHAGLAHTLLELDESRLASAHFHRAALLHRGHGRIEAALPFFREAVSKNPGDADLLEEYCELLLTTEHKEEQLHALSTLVELRMSRSEPARAAISLTRMLEIDPRFPGAKDILQDAARQLLLMAETSGETPKVDPQAIVQSAAELRST